MSAQHLLDLMRRQADEPPQQARYVDAAFAILRKRLDRIRTSGRREDIVQFLGAEAPAIADLMRLWDDLPRRPGVPTPQDLFAWL